MSTLLARWRALPLGIRQIWVSMINMAFLLITIVLLIMTVMLMWADRPTVCEVRIVSDVPGVHAA